MGCDSARDDYNPSGSVTKINRYGLGARGIDRIEHWDGSTTSYAYPIYDGHGNARAMLYRSGTSYGTQNWRTYDVWGSVRSSDTTSPNPTQRYCASLGHVADDDSGLIYMRARYLEPSTGRFVSEDPARDGWNWFVYCGSEPVGRLDETGQSGHPISGWQGLFGVLGMTCLVTAHIAMIGAYDPATLSAACYFSAIAIASLAIAFSLGDSTPINKLGALVLSLAGSAALLSMASTLTVGAKAGIHTLAHLAVTAAWAYGCILFAAIIGANLLDEMSHTNLFSGGGH